jgi:HD superfamily phosphohydrolase
MSDRSTLLRHLDEAYTEPIRDPIWKHIYLSEPLLQIVRSAAFQKLNGIKQLGPTYLIYPGATHTRFNHSLGVYHLAKRMITELLKKQLHTPLTLTGLKSFLCAALLHDLGHYPFAHSLKDLSIKDHETLTAEIILKNEELYTIIQRQLRVPPQTVASIIDFQTPIEDKNALFSRNLLSGVLDPDKLDYLNRDAYFCGIPYGTQDIDFIFRQIYPHPSRGIAITRKGLASVESILFSKYLMYRYVYWHRDVRIITAMIKKAILMGLRAGIIKAEDLYYLDDREFFSLMESHGFPPFKIIAAAWGGELYVPALSVPFSMDIAFHKKMENLERRLEFEAQIARRLTRKTGYDVREEEIVIDVPERISFEMDLAIINGSDGVPSVALDSDVVEKTGKRRESHVPDETYVSDETYISYEESGSVFSPDVVRGFTRSLRTIRLLVSARNNIARETKKIGLLSAIEGRVRA